MKSYKFKSDLPTDPGTSVPGRRSCRDRHHVSGQPRPGAARGNSHRRSAKHHISFSDFSQKVCKRVTNPGTCNLTRGPGTKSEHLPCPGDPGTNSNQTGQRHSGTRVRGSSRTNSNLSGQRIPGQASRDGARAAIGTTYLVSLAQSLTVGC